MPDYFRTDAHRKAPNTSRSIAGTKCDHCPALEILIRRRNRQETEHYYCNTIHGYIEPKTATCPDKSKRDETWDFNRWQR